MYVTQHLCRQGRSALQVTYDLDIFIVDCLDRVCAGDVTRDGVVNPVDLKTRLTGRLHLRLANIGHMSDLKSSKLSECHYFCYQNAVFPSLFWHCWFGSRPVKPNIHCPRWQEWYWACIQLATVTPKGRGLTAINSRKLGQLNNNWMFTCVWKYIPFCTFCVFECLYVTKYLAILFCLLEFTASKSLLSTH